MPAIEDVDPRLLWLLRKAGEEWGPAGVANVAARLVQPELQEEDLLIAVFRESEGPGWVVTNPNTSVKITHVPTGKSAVATARSGLQAKKEALIELRGLVFGD